MLPVAVALDKDGKPTAPLAKKLAALGFPDLQIERPRTRPGRQGRELLLHATPRRAAQLADGLQPVLEEAVAKLPIPKVMSYQRPDGETVQFVRPVHSLLALHGDAVVPLSLLGLTAGRATLGHRFLSDGQPFDIAHADQYAAALKDQGKVVAERRRAQGIDPHPAAGQGRRRPGADAGSAAGRSDRAGRMAGGVRVPLRGRVPVGAAGMPDPDHADQPEVLRADRRRTASCARAS